MTTTTREQLTKSALGAQMLAEDIRRASTSAIYGEEPYLAVLLQDLITTATELQRKLRELEGLAYSADEPIETPEA